MENLVDFARLILLPDFDYNTRVVLVGVIVYSIGCALVGNFMILQKRSLLADVLSHATFPGVVLIFVVMVVIGTLQYSKHLGLLMLGAALSTLLAVLVLLALQRHTILKPDAIQASILSIFFGSGVALLGIAQRMEGGSSAGMYSYIYGKTASMQLSDAYLFIVSSFVLLCVIVYRKRQLTILSFDTEYANSLDIHTARLDFIILALIVLQVIIGIQAIGLLMVSALFIIPVVIARFWTEKLNSIILISIAVGVVCGYVGALVSANSTRFPTGAVIVSVMEVVFIISLFFGSKKGILTKYIERKKFTNKMQIEHTLRLIYENMELRHTSKDSLRDSSIDISKSSNKYISVQTLSTYSGMAMHSLYKKLRRMDKLGLLAFLGSSIELSPQGYIEARRVIRNHRLWEAYLLYNTDASPETVDYSADKVEHILGEEQTIVLEKTLEDDASSKEYLTKTPPSPHHLVGVKKESAQALANAHSNTSANVNAGIPSSNAGKK